MELRGASGVLLAAWRTWPPGSLFLSRGETSAVEMHLLLVASDGRHLVSNVNHFDLRRIA